jgi:hypothetical protein
MIRKAPYVTTLGVAVVLSATAAAQDDLRKPKVDMVTIVGCVAHPDEKTWLLTNAGGEVATTTPYAGEKEIAGAKSAALGQAKYRLIGTNDFVTNEELVKDKQRAAFTTPQTANATGSLRPGRKVMVKALLIKAPDEKRLNLLSVQPLADTCP